MTDQHPLHPKLIDALSEYKTCEEAMRAAADWQLEQVIRSAKLNCWCWFEKSSSKESFIVELQKAMRPTTTND